MSAIGSSTTVLIEDETSNDAKDMQAVFDEEEILDDKPRSILLNILKQVTSGTDLTRVSMPAFISEPRSFIETTANLFSHMAFFREAIAMDDPVDRIAHLTRFYISGFHIRPRGVKKPYNPILGEVFRCFWDHPDGTRTWYIGEQVQHHPPVSAMYFENLDAGYTIEGEIKIKSNFTGNSAGTFMLGTIFVHLLRRRETYTITYPVWYARGVVVGKMRMETVGKTRIACEQTGLEALVNFKAKPTFGGKYNQVKAEIFEMQGGATPMGEIKKSVSGSSFTTPSPSPSSASRSASSPSPSSSACTPSPASVASESPSSTPSPFSTTPSSVSSASSSSPSSSASSSTHHSSSKKKDSKRKPLVTIQGDWTSAIWAVDHRQPPHLTPPVTLSADRTEELAFAGASSSHNESSQSSSSSPFPSPSSSSSSSSSSSPSGKSAASSSLPVPSPLAGTNAILFFDVRTSPFTSKRALAVPHQEWYESRAVWRSLTDAMRVKDYEKALKEKAAVEDEARRRAKERVAKKVGWRQRYFHWDPAPHTAEERKESPNGRWRFNWSIDCANSTEEELNPCGRRITCYNVPDMAVLMETAPALTHEHLKKDEDTKATDFLTLDEAVQAMEKKGLGNLRAKWPMGPPPCERGHEHMQHQQSLPSVSAEKSIEQTKEQNECKEPACDSIHPAHLEGIACT
ncbi:putative oxysterol-binding protein 8 [Monocercomonoides exilis]|uniref:putative oxysterol-binding protein 8 n=1 Tax=Monocercomonoides exilis TaxID=2049356 RepID=UPI00355958CD|nr:putative oxysterol-binding protein 8 [Monocercomonoides exilis]|eukprot:MONOS_2290.1-p1 / transcript=MONOS_2290.1 / gene=MONOS_2290 / organism=Monocercomonoides_exilis_PA203 / gene_product=oxysterol-binding protein 8 / transcript_product=oxysterol-binding protein 8 / location=Mono_scaffold00046:112968-115156(+) / protein_length=684 / sequence_SO=supercontig / SO=protein_coding / is_pseudo=false